MCVFLKNLKVFVCVFVHESHLARVYVVSGVMYVHVHIGACMYKFRFLCCVEKKSYIYACHFYLNV